MTRIVLSLALFLFALSAAAQVYSWKDADGRIHYSDHPPAEKAKDAKRLGTAAQPPEGADAARKAVAEKEIEGRKEGQKTKEAAEKAEKEKSAAAEKQPQCERAKANLASIESGQIRFVVGANGEKVALEGSVRDSELANARKAVDSWCK
jgi:hypothetical protein